MSQASARHILVADESFCLSIKEEIANGADFGELAKKHSQCPSGKKGGDLGRFGPGQMVKEFDSAVFEGEIGRVLGPVDTQFGSHLILVSAREEK